MSNRVERLRVWLVGSAVFLLLVIAAFMGSARYLRRHYLAGLPVKLGVNIVRETNGYTYCQSVQGRTVYCIHAAKAVEHTDGKIALHDVSIVLYGKKGDRSDRIYGDEFEYDQKEGVVRATGLVHIDLMTAGVAGRAAKDHSGAKMTHVTTSGLVYLQKLGVAATSENIEFEAGGIAGHAKGADYASDSGMLTLHSAVNMSGVTGGRQMALTAATAEFDDRNQEAFLTQATYESEGRTAKADQARLHRRPDGTLSRVEAQGNVTAELVGAKVVSQRADISLGAASRPQTALLTGGVKYTSDRTLHQMRAQAEQATIAFDGQAKPQPEHAVFTGAVHMTERTRATESAKDPWSTRDLIAERFEAALAPAGPGRSELRDATATGRPHVTIMNNGSLANNRSAGTTELSADHLTAHMTATGDARQPPQLDTISGLGHTVLRQLTADGIEQTSTGDRLDAKFRPKPPSTGMRRSNVVAPATQQIADALVSEVQVGHVMMTRRAPARSQGKAGLGIKAGGPVAAAEDMESASAERAAYDGDLDRMTLTGSVQLGDSGSALWADNVTLDHKTGDAHAMGVVKMNYVEDASSAVAGAVRISPTHTRLPGPVGSQRTAPAEPTHILADRADLVRATQIATFYGKPVRIWQGGNQVQAPAIEFSRAQKRMTARAEAATGSSTAAQVHTVLAAGGNDATGAAKQGAAKPGLGVAACDVRAAAKPAVGTPGTDARSPSVVRIASGGLIYSEVQRRADFTGGFRADTVDGTIRAGQAAVYLRQAAGIGGADAGAGEAITTTGPSLAGDLDRVIATEHVELDKPGLHATGGRLVYTASDRVALLTGDKDAQPKAVDAQGTTTGATLRFQSSCDGSSSGTVEVLGAQGERVSTDARISDDGRKEKGKR